MMTEEEIVSFLTSKGVQKGGHIGKSDWNPYEG